MNTLVFSISGAIILYLLGHSDKSPLLRFGMLLPIVLSGLTGSFLLYAGLLSGNTQIPIRHLNEQLGFNIFPAVDLLRLLLFIFGLLHGLVALGSIWLLCLLR